MAKGYKYTLESYVRHAPKYECPKCGQKEFTRYVYSDTQNYVADQVGICGRRVNCDYHYHPSKFFNDQPELKKVKISKVAKAEMTEIPKQTSYIPDEIFKKYVSRNMAENHLVQNLRNYFSEEQLHEVHQRYFFGTANNGATVFFQIDVQGKVRAGKIINYDPKTGKRNKNENPPANWVHSILKIPEFHLKQCFFGERLITKFPEKKVAIVEGEKTAIICSLLYPEWNWLAAGSLDGLSVEKCQVLRGKRVVLFPDIDAHLKWMSKADELQRLTNFYVSSYLYNNVPPEQRAKQDIADFLLLDLAAIKANENSGRREEMLSNVSCDQILETIPTGIVDLSKKPNNNLPVEEIPGKVLSEKSIIETQRDSEGERIVNNFDKARQKIMDVPFYATGTPFAVFEIVNFATVCEIVQNGRYKGEEHECFRFIDPASRNEISVAMTDQETNFYWPGIMCERSFIQNNKNQYYHNGLCGFNICIKNIADRKIDLRDTMKTIALIPNVLLVYRSSANGLVCFTCIGSVDDTYEYRNRMVVFSNYIIQKLGNCFGRSWNNCGIFRINHDPDGFLFTPGSKIFKWTDFLKATDTEEKYIEYKNSPRNLLDGAICEYIS